MVIDSLSEIPVPPYPSQRLFPFPIEGTCTPLSTPFNYYRIIESGGKTWMEVSQGARGRALQPPNGLSAIFTSRESTVPYMRFHRELMEVWGSACELYSQVAIAGHQCLPTACPRHLMSSMRRPNTRRRHPVAFTEACPKLVQRRTSLDVRLHTSGI